MDKALKTRLGLYLRSEQAMGLASLPVRLAPPVITSAAPAASGRSQAPASRAAPPVVAPPAPPASRLFASGDDCPLQGEPMSRQAKIAALAALNADEVRECQKCRLGQQRTHTVFGEGDPDAAILFIGEGPGESEDLSGRPFVGRAGQKLEEMIAAMGLRRDAVYIANVVKCRPPGNRAPSPDELGACTPILVRQIEIIRPKVIVTLGLPATRFILNTDLSMGRLRGQWHSWRGVKVMPTYHPAYILRNYTPETRGAVWSDLQKVMAELGLKPPNRAWSIARNAIEK